MRFNCFYLLTALCLGLLASGTIIGHGAAHAQSAGSTPLTGCKELNATHVNILPRTDAVTYEFTRSLSDIQSVKIDTVDPYGVHSGSITQGFMEGQISAEHKIKLDYELVDQNGQVCLWYKNVDVDVHITPKIVIAREVKSDSCMYKAVLAHEQKHVEVDRKLVNEMAKYMGKALYTLMSRNGFSVGPIDPAIAETTAQNMMQQANDTLNQVYQAMMTERAKRQGNVDSREEYDRVSALCPDFYKHRENLLKNALKVKQGQP